MTVYGLSQSSGVERRLEVEGADGRVRLHVHGKPGEPSANIDVPAMDLVTALTEGGAGLRTLEGTAPVQGGKRLLDLEVKRNEVLLNVRPEAGDGCDIAIGFDDLQDAVEAAM